MGKRKVFTVPEQGENLEFEVAGQVFRCHGRIASGVLLSLGEVVSGGDPEAGEGVDVAEMVKALRNFFDAAIIAEDRDKWHALLDDPEIAVPFQTLSDIAGWLAGEYAGDRPTGPPSPPTAPSGSSGGDSTATATPEGSTSSHSRPTAVST